MNANDPLYALRADDRPAAPDPDFARRLRERLVRAAHLPEGVDMTITDIPDIAAPLKSQVAELVPRPGALPYLTVERGLEAIDWYTTYLGARLAGEPILMDDGSLGHAELEIGGGVIYLADAFGDLGLHAPTPDNVSVSLMVSVPDTDAALAAARSGGAQVTRDPYEGHGTRTAVIIDPFGHRWMLTGPTQAVAGRGHDPVRRGDVVYVSLVTPDSDRAAAFYGAVLGWEYDTHTRQVTNLTHRLGLSSQPTSPGLFLVYAVDDLEQARMGIGAAGGAEVTEPDRHPGSLGAVDDQRARFAVYVPDPAESRGKMHPAGQGDLTYITVHTPDSRAMREFYSSVLGWQFTAGRIDDGWEVVDSRPQIGFAGGADHHEAVAMWVVTDIDDAVVRVVKAGGVVTAPPTTMPYARVAECIDDQGIPFYLGQY